MKTLTRPVPPAKKTPIHRQDKAGTWLEQWEPENPEFYSAGGAKMAWRTLAVTTYCLFLAFATWFMVSAIVVKLSGIGFALSASQLFWLAAMPGLAAGTLRIVHTFLIPIFGTRHTITISTALLLIPCIGWGVAVQNPQTPFWILMTLAFLAGLGGGNFSSFMPSTSLFFPKKKQGTALGIQAGIGNFGVSVVQFLTPAIIGLSILGASQTFVQPGKASTTVALQNAAFVWVPFVLVGVALAWLYLRSVPLKASFREQTDIFKNKHTWIMTSLYMMTFGSFSGLAAAFPLLIKQVYGGFPNAPDPLTYAFLGPLVGASIRVAFGPVSDRLGGARVTMLSAVGMIVCAFGVATKLTPTSVDEFGSFVWWMLGLFLFAGIGNASTFKQIPMIFVPRQAAGVIGWTSAIAAYGPFLVSVLLASILARTGNASSFFVGLGVFCALNAALNWWFYSRKGAERSC
ncbi:MAG TPA: nitrate/nitrite transporter [Fimbriimonadaceae bacterium]|nr:nitrate/nitrite transporter [Fimbriimonadaceae bacterium]